MVKNQDLLKSKKKMEYSRYIDKTELDKACFQHDVASRDFPDLAKRTSSEKVLRDKAFNIAKNQKYGEYQRSLAFKVYKFFDKKRLQVVALKMKLNKINNFQVNFIKQLLKNFKKEKYICHSETISGVLI